MSTQRGECDEGAVVDCTKYFARIIFSLVSVLDPRVNSIVAA